MTTPLLRTINLTKRFGSLTVLDGVSLTLDPGEVVGLVGRRGSGKSVFLNLLAGVHRPSAGEIQLRGQTVNFTRPYAARSAGVKIVHQNPILVENLQVINSIFLGQEICWPRPIGLPNLRAMIQRGAALLDQFDMPVNLLAARVGQLSDEQRQVVAIAQALCHPSPLLLLDDPLVPLSFQRQQLLLKQVKLAASQGVAVIVSGDNLQHLFAVTDKIAVLYEGRINAILPTAETTPREVVELMIGTTRPEQVTPIIWALDSYHAAQQQADELRAAEESLRETLEAKDTLNKQLIVRLREQLTALDDLNLALQNAHRRLLTEREEERKYIARELHDQVIQDLLTVNYRLEDLEANDPVAMRSAELSSIQVDIRQMVGDLRQLCSDLRPPTIDNHGLAPAIRSYAQQWADQTGIALTMDIDLELGRLPESIELSVFRIVQEGLNNIRKHSGAHHTEILLKRTPTASLLVRLSDDGRGMKQASDLAALSAQRRFGLLGISERVALLRGTMQIESPSAGGVQLQVEIPSPYPSVN